MKALLPLPRTALMLPRTSTCTATESLTCPLTCFWSKEVWLQAGQSSQRLAQDLLPGLFKV